jgi:hypothetical protein
MPKISSAQIGAFIVLTLVAWYGSAQARSSGWQACQDIKNDDRAQLQCF